MDLTCPECEKPCGATTVDQGYGYTSYGSHVTNDVHLVVCSDCCEAPFDDETAQLIGEMQGLKDCDD